MERIEPPRPAVMAARTAARRDTVFREPATSQALWPTFMRRTLDDEQVRPTVVKPQKPS